MNRYCLQALRDIDDIEVSATRNWSMSIERFLMLESSMPCRASNSSRCFILVRMHLRLRSRIAARQDLQRVTLNSLMSFTSRQDGVVVARKVGTSLQRCQLAIAILAVSMGSSPTGPSLSAAPAQRSLLMLQMLLRCTTATSCRDTATSCRDTTDPLRQSSRRSLYPATHSSRRQRIDPAARSLTGQR